MNTEQRGEHIFRNKHPTFSIIRRGKDQGKDMECQVSLFCSII